MAPPIARGGARVVRQLQGLLFLAVLAALVLLTIGIYNKWFTDRVAVTLQADRIGNQLTTGADVKARGVIIGEVTSVRATAEGSELELRLDPAKAGLVPADTRARILPTTLFGEKFVALDFDLPTDPASGRQTLADGGVITQDRSETARETTEALDNLLPLLQTLNPESVSTTLNAVSSALRGRGDRIGSNLTLAGQYFEQFNPELGRFQENVRGTADLADTFTAATPDLVSLLDDLSAVNRNLVRDEAALDRVLRDTAGVARTAEDFVGENEQRFLTLARESVPNLEVYARYSPQFPCLFGTIVDQLPLGEAFGGLQPGLHITLKFTRDNGGYVPGDETEYLDDSGPTCRSLGTAPRERPIPEFKDAQDGYRDGQEVEPSTGRRSGEPPEGPGGPYTYPDQRRKAPQDQGTQTSASGMPMSAATYDRAAVGAVVAPALGLRPDEVPDVAVLLLAPVARDTVVRAS